MSSMRKWVEMCMDQKWAYAKETETICLEPLDLREGDLIKNLIDYAQEVGRQLSAIFDNPETLRHREHIDTILIPTRVKGGWTLYCSSRFSHTQCMVKLRR